MDRKLVIEITEPDAPVGREAAHAEHEITGSSVRKAQHHT